VILGIEGTSDLNALHSRKLDHQVQHYAVDILAMDSDDRGLCLHMRKANLEQLWSAGRASPWRLSSAARSAPTYSTRHAASASISEHRDRPYRGGCQKIWIQVKNRSYPAMECEL